MRAFLSSNILLEHIPNKKTKERWNLHLFEKDSCLWVCVFLPHRFLRFLAVKNGGYGQVRWDTVRWQKRYKFFRNTVCEISWRFRSLIFTTIRRSIENPRRLLRTKLIFMTTLLISTALYVKRKIDTN